MIVVDASVAVKWFVPEQDSDKAATILRSDQRLLAPDIIRIEVAATFTRLLRMGDIDPTKAQILLDKWRYYVVQQAIALEQTPKHLKDAEDLSMTLSHQLQDCLYLSMANRLNVVLLTADAKFCKKATAAGHDIKLLADQ